MRQLDYKKTKNMLDKYKLPCTKSDIAKTKEQAINIAKRIGFPVALKIIAEEIIHKSDADGVKTDLKNEEKVNSAYERLLKTVNKKFPKAKIEGILVQKMEIGIEVIIGMKRDPQFDSVIMFGLGGIFVEVLKDVSFRIAPIDKTMAEEMINEIKGSKILKGTRGQKPINISALVDLLVKVSKLSIENKNLIEVDFNPVIVDEKSAKIVDVRMMTA